ncbi:MAG: class I SAM-dependent methyltransferase [Kiritimatiellales bacterium]|nr:class I SAM-dependent methyltransferase [Kiritimatiellales bacterium]
MAYSDLAWSAEPTYGDVFYERAIGKAPEMESSKATAKQLKGLIQADTKVLDVGCGSGHYLRSLRREYPVPFFYEGADITPHYIDLAKKAYSDDSHANFQVASVGKLPYESKKFDVVICCNVLLHLPDVARPLQELWRVTKGTLLVRTHIGTTNFRIQQVPEPETYSGKMDPVFKPNGEPRERHFYNIYSEKYIKWLFNTFDDVADVSIQRDEDFDPTALGSSQWPEDKKPSDLTEVWHGWQIHHYILQPWSFLRVTRK